MTDRLFPSLLKYWRGRRGQSQLDLAVNTSVSSRHISFLESGRSKPSEDMVLRLMASLGVPLRDQNEALKVAGFAPRFSEPELHAISPVVDWVIERMLQQQEPYPLMVLSADYRIIRRNLAADHIFSHFVAEPRQWAEPCNMYDLVFNPALARTFVVDWEHIAPVMLARLHREILQAPANLKLAALLAQTLRYPGVHKAWRYPDFSTPLATTLGVWLRREALSVGFMATVTKFAPSQLVTMEEVSIESYFPLDAPTRATCERLAAENRALDTPSSKDGTGS